MREIAKVAFRLFLIMILAGLCLGATYTVTKDPIAQQELLQQEADRRAVLPEAATFEEVAIEPTGAVTACFRGLSESGEPCGYALSVTASGFGGDIAMTVGVSDGVVTGVRIGTHSETPGLGAKAADDGFLSQFTGKGGELTARQLDMDLAHALAHYLHLDQVTLILCGGQDQIAAQREQWNDGSNTLCIRPGVVIAYDRNYITNEILESYGITVLKIPSGELSRGRGGPRCMSMPLIRDVKF